MIDKFVEKQEQAADHADDDEADDSNDDDDDDDDEGNEDEDADNDDDDDVEPNDRGSSENDVKATSDTKESAPARVAAAGVAPRDETRQCADGDADYEWSVNISSTESEDNTAMKGFSKTFLITFVIHFYLKCRHIIVNIGV